MSFVRVVNQQLAGRAKDILSPDNAEFGTPFYFLSISAGPLPPRQAFLAWPNDEQDLLALSFEQRPIQWYGCTMNLALAP
jgi:hypothetical protein